MAGSGASPGSGGGGVTSLHVWPVGNEGGGLPTAIPSRRNEHAPCETAEALKARLSYLVRVGGRVGVRVGVRVRVRVGVRVRVRDGRRGCRTQAIAPATRVSHPTCNHM
eukprot:scaffold32953_cov64-Phaeocystis_antarctica.AAC.5